ncbi:MAG: anaerobic ribonucleoside-triphosphate reductase activating protein [Lentisphaeria bacterium]|nr:anaerobic ribonucleoside-triphosphate reductase activating protein [Lentisphaeria bacterium]
MRLGLQKLTLLDFPGVMACTVFTCGCNFRCPFCHNASLVTGRDADMPLSADEVLSFLAGRRKMLDGVCITGGEPLLHPEMKDFIAGVKAMGYKVKLDTNGSNPARLREILAAGTVDYVAMDIKQSQEKYAIASGSESALAPVRESVDMLKTGPVEFEFRTTVVAPLHTPDDMERIAKWIAGAEHYYLQNFADSGDILAGGGGFAPVDREILNEMLARVRPFVPGAAIRGK